MQIQRKSAMVLPRAICTEGENLPKRAPVVTIAGSRRVLAYSNRQQAIRLYAKTVSDWVC